MYRLRIDIVQYTLPSCWVCFAYVQVLLCSLQQSLQHSLLSTINHSRSGRTREGASQMPTWAGLQLKANRHLIISQADRNAQSWCTNSGFNDCCPPQHHLQPCNTYEPGLYKRESPISGELSYALKHAHPRCLKSTHPGPGGKALLLLFMYVKDAASTCRLPVHYASGWSKRR